MPKKQISTQTWIGIACGAGCLLVLIVGGGLIFLGVKFAKDFMPRTTTYEQAQREVYFLVMKPSYLPPGVGEPRMMLMNMGRTPVSWMQMFMQVYRRGGNSLAINQMRGDIMPTILSKEMDTVNGRQVYLQRQGGRETAIVKYDTTVVMVSGNQLNELKMVAASMEPVFPDQLDAVRKAQQSHPIPSQPQPPAMPGLPGGR